MGMRLSAPSRLKRFWPRYLRWRNASKASAALSRSRMRSWSAFDTSPVEPSTWRWIQSFWSGSWMCMYSTPTDRA